MTTPLMSLSQDGSRAPVLSYNVPDSTSYGGTCYLTMAVPPKWLLGAQPTNPPASAPVLGPSIADALRGGDIAGVVSRFLAEEYMPAPAEIAPAISVIRALSAQGRMLEQQRMTDALRAGLRPLPMRSMTGETRIAYLPKPPPKPATFFLVERYRLSTFLGDYGAGRTLNTFSLLPGEKTKISIKSYQRSKETKKGTSSIFDSFDSDSADEFETSLREEQADKRQTQEAFAWHAEANVSADFWGVAKASAAGGAKGSTNGLREELTKNIAAATSKHSQKASAKRKIEVNTSSEQTTEEGEESAIERELVNVNVSRTLNFVFRQMNQEVITVLHLVDVRIGFAQGEPKDYQEVTLPELDTLLEANLRPEHVAEARAAILSELATMLDHAGQPANSIEERTAGGRSYHCFSRRKQQLQLNDNGMSVDVDGVIMSIQKNVLRTDCVIVEAILGQGQALDDYAIGLQREAVNAEVLKNRAKEQDIARGQLAMDVVNSADEARANVFARVFPPPPPAPPPVT